jgi:hypothetical protein
MIDYSNDISLRKAAIVAGFGLLIMTIFAIFAHFFVFKNLIMPGDATTTVNNIMGKETLFRTGIFSYIIVIVMDIVVAWALFVFLKPVNKSLSLLTAWFRVVYATIFAIALNNLFNVLQLLNRADYLKVLETGQLRAQVMLSLNAFTDGWAIGFVFFGLHLGLLGYLVFKSNYIPKFLGILLIIAGVGYLIDNIGEFLVPNFNLAINMVTGWGELIFMFWLLIKGSKIQEPNKG